LLSRGRLLTSASEQGGLPPSMLEAAAQRAAFLSAVDPDGFDSKLGWHVRTDDFESGLRYLLEDDRWRERGLDAWRHVAATFETARAVEKHIEAYCEALDARSRR